jgi:hypothetical protein
LSFRKKYKLLLSLETAKDSFEWQFEWLCRDESSGISVPNLEMLQINTLSQDQNVSSLREGSTPHKNKA